jgi:hypothetical protein
MVLTATALAERGRALRIEPVFRAEPALRYALAATALAERGHAFRTEPHVPSRTRAPLPRLTAAL